MIKVFKMYTHKIDKNIIKTMALIFADTVEELTTEYNNYSFLMGTKAYIINSAEWYMLNGSGEWKSMMPAEPDPEAESESNIDDDNA